uniref:Uncharacterized protein n=1 Tax=Nonomuraea gerenzanensis TaxID=93944 RepID=A0A1M4ELX5_9ACTN|nr:hypothetical protein BN4615_P9363 [Nonomuraea gerenzanensis]
MPSRGPSVRRMYRGASCKSMRKISFVRDTYFGIESAAKHLSGDRLRAR